MAPPASGEPPLVARVAPSASNSERRVVISLKAIERLQEIAPRWDKYYLENAYIEWAKDKEPARNEDARFLAG